MNLIEHLSSSPLITIDNEPLSVEVLSNKAVLFVNVASFCGYTRQYSGLVTLQQNTQGLQIIGVPCNQFGQQEPGNPDEIMQFCHLNFEVNFPLLAKQDVNGHGRSPLYEWLISSAEDIGLGGEDVAWNFEKFIIGRNGLLISRFPSRISPQSAELAEAISIALDG